MTKKEVNEIRKQFNDKNCAITRICGCYVDGEKQKKLEFKEAFLSLPEEERFKYYELFRKTLGGTVGRNLLNLTLPMKEEAEGGTQEFLYRLRESKLTDTELIGEFYDKIIEHYDAPGNFLILLIHSVYDVSRWTMLPTRYLTIFSAASVLLHSLSPDSATMPKRIPYITAYRTGLLTNPKKAFFSRHSTREALISMPHFIFQKTRMSLCFLLWTRS